MDPKEGKTAEPLDSGTVSTRLQRIAQLARKYPERVFQSIHHTIDIELLGKAYTQTRKVDVEGFFDNLDRHICKVSLTSG